MPELRLGIDARGALSGAAQFNSAVDSIQRHSASVSNAVSGLSRMLKGVFATTSIVMGVKAVASAFMESEKAANDLNAALAMTGDKSAKAMSHFQDFAAQMQKLTKYEDDEILSQIAYAKNLGVSTNQLDDAAVAAAGLAARYRIDLASAMQLIGRASQGQTQMLSRYGIVLDETGSDQEKFNELLKIGADSFRLAEAETKTLEGGLAQIKNALNDTLESFGGLLPSATGAADVVNNFNARLRESSEEAAKFGASGMSLETAFKAAAIPAALLIDIAETLYGIITAIATAIVAIPEQMLKAIQGTIDGIEYLSEKLAETWVGQKVGIGKIDIDTSSLEAWIAGFEEQRKELGKAALYFTVQRENLTYNTLKDIANPPQAKAAKLNTDTIVDDNAGVSMIKLSEKQVAAEKKIKDSFQTLKFERTLIGKTNDERERAVEMMKLQNEAEVLYGKNSAETTRILADYEQELIKLQEARQLQKIADDIGMAFATTFEDMVLGAKSASEAMRALAQDVARLMMRQMVTQQIANVASAAITAGVTSFMAPSTGPMAAGNMSSSGVNPNAQIGGVNSTTGMGFHDGGCVGYDSPSFYRNVDSSMFRHAPRFHEGLLPQEYPAILKRGETVRTEEQEAALSKSNGGSNVRIVNVIDPSVMGKYMNSSDGEKVVMNVISKNSTSIKGMLN